MNEEVWGEKWTTDTLNNLNVVGSPDFDLCNNCFCPTNINVALIVEIDGKSVILCKNCQNKINI